MIKPEFIEKAKKCSWDVFIQPCDPKGEDFMEADISKIAQSLQEAHSAGRKEIEKELMAELRDPNGTIWEYAKKQQDRDGNAKIKLAYSTKTNPFAYEDLEILDFGVSDNIYIVGSKLFEAQQKRIDMAVEVLKAGHNGEKWQYEKAEEEAIKILTE